VHQARPDPLVATVKTAKMAPPVTMANRVLTGRPVRTIRVARQTATNAPMPPPETRDQPDQRGPKARPERKRTLQRRAHLDRQVLRDLLEQKERPVGQEQR